MKGKACVVDYREDAPVKDRGNKKIYNHDCVADLMAEMARMNGEIGNLKAMIESQKRNNKLIESKLTRMNFSEADE